MNLANFFNKNFTAGETAFRRIDSDGVHMESFAGRSVLRVDPDALRRLAREAFSDVNFLLRTGHLEGWAAVLDNPATSANDRFVVAALLKNAALSAEGVLPLCQDTGTATVVAFKGESVFTGCDDAAEMEAGIRDTYATRNLRFSQTAPLTMFEERNTGDNLPAQIDIYAASGDEYQFLFLAKGGGSSNKTSLFQQTKALLNEESFTQFLKEKVKALGVAACPPYHLGLVVGGTSPEFNLKILKLATVGALDHLPEEGNSGGQPFRDRHWERRPWRAVRRKIPGAFRPGYPLRAARRELSGLAGGFVQCASQRTGADHRRRDICGTVRSRSRPISTESARSASESESRGDGFHRSRSTDPRSLPVAF
jgi:fumarate hydratase, class I